MALDLEKIQLYMTENTSSRKDISDDEYFSSKYGKYISNSRLKLINEDQGGNPDLFFNGIKSDFSPSLALGSAVHELTLQPEEFELGPEIDLPTGKLGAAAVAAVERYRKGGVGMRDALRYGCRRVSYYVNQIDKHIDDVFNAAKRLYLERSKINSKKEIIWLDNKTRIICIKCVDSIKKNQRIQSRLHPTSVFGEIPSFNEDALFVDFTVISDGKAIIIPAKLKIDNWTIDSDSKSVCVNDLKTTSGFVKSFMEDGDHFDSFHYARQMAFYLDIAKFYLMNNKEMKEKYQVDDTWTFEVNMFVVNTSKDQELQYSQCFTVPDEQIQKGREEYQRLVKTVGYYMIKDGKSI